MILSSLLFLLNTVIATSRLPNIVLIIADDIGRTDHSIYHNSKRSLPNFEHIAREGLILNNLYTSPVCSPTRSSIMTGLYPFRIGMQHSETILPGSTAHIPLEDKIIPERLIENGYESYHIGKWHMGYAHQNFTSLGRGFKTHYGYYQGQVEYTDKTILNGYDMWRDGEPDFSASEEHSTIQYINEITTVLDRVKEPFFLYIALQTVHLPLEGRLENFQQCQNEKGYWNRKYCELLFDLDLQIEHIYNELKNNQLYDNSLIIFLSDNGGMTAFGTEPTENEDENTNEPPWPTSRGFNAPLRGSKTTLFEGGVKSTGFISGGFLDSKWKRKVFDKPLHVVDLYTTILHSAELFDYDNDGQNIFYSDFHKEDIPINLINNGLSYSAIRCNDIKLIFGKAALWKEADGWWSSEGHEPPPVHTEPVYIFNLTSDPYERQEISVGSQIEGEVFNNCLLKLRNYLKERFTEPQLNLILPGSLPYIHNGTWAPFL